MNSSWVLLFPFFLIHPALIKAELFPNAKHLVSLQQKPFQQLRRREAARLCQDPAALVIAILITGVKESQNFNPRLPGIVVWAVVLQQHSLEIHQVQTEMWEVRSPFPTFQSLLPAGTDTCARASLLPDPSQEFPQRLCGLGTSCR